MRKMNELTTSELAELFNKNLRFLDHIIQNYCYDESGDMVNEYLSYFRHYNKNTNRETWSISDYSFGGVYSSYIKVYESDYTNFLEDVKNLDSVYGILYEDTYPLFKRLLDKAEFFDLCVSGCEDISDQRWFQFEKWFRSGIQKIINAVVAVCDGEYDKWDDHYFIADYILSCIPEILDDYTIDTDGKVYETIVKCYS